MFEEKWGLIPAPTRKILVSFSSVFQQSGYECYLVGGSCRDLILGVQPKDYDFATNCPISKIRSLFKQVINTGVSHGTVTIPFKGHHFEVTRFRKDIKTDGRRAIVEFSESVVEDQKRRDLRINAIAYDVVKKVVIDSQNGLQDFKDRMIRFVGDVTERIREDHLRALRYVRIIASLEKFNFQYDVTEMEAVKTAFNSQFLSIERIYDEFNKIFLINHKNCLFLSNALEELEVFRGYLPATSTDKKFYQKILETSSLYPFFLKYQKIHGNKKTALDLKISRKTRLFIGLLHKYQFIESDQESEIKLLMSEVEDQDLKILGNIFHQQLDVDFIKTITLVCGEMIPFRIAHLALKGHEMLDLGIRGKKIGELQQYLLKEVRIKPDVNQKKQLLKLAKKYLKVQ